MYINTLKWQVKTIKDAFEKISNAKGKEKEKAISDCLQNEVAADGLLYLLDPGIVFHIGEKSFNKDVGLTDTIYEDFFEMCDELNALPALPYMTISKVKTTLTILNNEDLYNEGLADFAHAFLCKTLKIGVTAKTVNKVNGYEFIPEFRCMLANKYFDHLDKVEGKCFYLTEKLDGIRCIALVSPTSAKLFSRQGQRIEGLLDVEKELTSEARRLGKRFMLDGELLIANRSGIQSKDQYKATTMIVRRDGVKTGIAYNVFDVLDYDDFINRTSGASYADRRHRLNHMFRTSGFVRVLPVLYRGTDTTEITKYLNAQRRLGHEGVMVNIADEPYQFTRTNALLKVKVMQDADLLVTGIQEGTGRYKGLLGALIVDYKGTPVGVGSGIDDDTRLEVWRHPEQYIGRVAKVQYFEETHGEDGLPSIRFPVFLEFREIGKEVSYN